MNNDPVPFITLVGCFLLILSGLSEIALLINSKDIHEGTAEFLWTIFIGGIVAGACIVPMVIPLVVLGLCVLGALAGVILVLKAFDNDGKISGGGTLFGLFAINFVIALILYYSHPFTLK